MGFLFHRNISFARGSLAALFIFLGPSAALSDADTVNGDDGHAITQTPSEASNGDKEHEEGTAVSEDSKTSGSSEATEASEPLEQAKTPEASETTGESETSETNESTEQPETSEASQSSERGEGTSPGPKP